MAAMAAADPAGSPAAADLVVDPAEAEARERLTVDLNRMVNGMAGRDDLLLVCVWNTDRGGGQRDAPAWYTPAELLVTINAAVGLQGTSPSAVNPLTFDGRRRCPVLIGLLSHESGHAHSTVWPEGLAATVTPPVAQALALLEEPRIEYRQVGRRPQDRPFLRAGASALNLDHFATGRSPVADRWAAATAAVLILGRVDAGVLDPDDARPVTPALRELLGDDDLRALAEVWCAALEVPDGDVDTMLDLAMRWVAIVGEPTAAEMPPVGCHSAAASDDAASDTGPARSSADTGPEDGPLRGALVAALDAAVSSARAGAQDELDTEITTGPDPAALAARMQSEDDAAAQRASRATATAVFESARAGSGVTLGSPRPPTEDERALARAMGEALRRARFRDRTITTRMSATPPGRLNGRDAMLGAAQHSRGAAVTARPFKSVVRRRVPEPPVTLGIAVDVSGSMWWAEEIMATVAWAAAHAVTSVHGRSASVSFGTGIAPLAHPGHPPAQVTPFSADASWENFSGAFAALDGALNLTRGDGVRVLVVVSDGEVIGDGQPEAAQDAADRMRRGGGHVLWIPRAAVIPAGATPVDVDLSPRPAPPGLTGGEIDAFERQDAARRMARIPEAITAALTATLRA
jgi:hypothetical protein